jgi:uncharacterized protein YfaS (alpha-2-macroglobulin family)
MPEVGEGGLLLTVYTLIVNLPNYDYPQVMALGVVTANLTGKRAPDEALIWVTDIESAAPVANATVSLYRSDGTLFALGATDQDGIFRAPVDLRGSDFYARSSADAYGVGCRANVSLTVSGYVHGPPDYRPGETCISGALRDRR